MKTVINTPALRTKLEQEKLQ